MKPKRLIQLRVDPELYTKIQESAKLDRRPMTQWIIVACCERVSRTIPEETQRDN